MAGRAHTRSGRPCLPAWQGVWSVARTDGGYVALAGDTDTRTLKLHELIVGSDRTVRLGSHRPVDFPDGFTPAVLHGAGTRLLVGGGKVVEAQRAFTLRPALFEITGGRLGELPIGDVAAQVGWGTVTDMVAVPGTGLAMLVEGSPGHQQPYGERVVVAETVDGGATWFSDTVATGLGEGWLGGLAVGGGALVAIAVDEDGRRTVYQRAAGKRTSWTRVDAGPGGMVLGAVSGRGGSVVVFSPGEDRIVRQRYDTTKRRWIPAATDAVAGATTHAVMTVGGASGEWLAIGERSARLISE
jgi:hypothetical protein